MAITEQISIDAYLEELRSWLEENWDPDLTLTVSVAGMHDNMDYTPFEGVQLQGWPVTMISRGEFIVEGGELKAKRGRGQFLKRAPFDATGYSAGAAPELDPAQNFGATLL